MESATTRRQPSFLDINEMGNGFSTNSLISRRSNLSFDSSISSTRRFYDTRFEQQPHFLDSCFLCNNPLAHNRDIFMYRGDVPFCSEECRQQQIDMDEAKDKIINLSALREKDHINSNTTQQFHLRTDRLVAA